MEYRSDVWLFALTSSVDLLKISCISTEHNEKKHVYRKCCLLSFKPFTWRCGSDYNKVFHVQAKEPYWGNMGVASLGTRWIWEVEFTSPPLWPRKRTQWIETCLNFLEKDTFLFPPRDLNSGSSSPSVHRQCQKCVILGLSYTDSCHYAIMSTIGYLYCIRASPAVCFPKYLVIGKFKKEKKVKRPLCFITHPPHEDVGV